MALLDIEKWIDCIIKKIDRPKFGRSGEKPTLKGQRSSLSTRIRRSFPFWGLMTIFNIS